MASRSEEGERHREMEQDNEEQSCRKDFARSQSTRIPSPPSGFLHPSCSKAQSQEGLLLPGLGYDTPLWAPWSTFSQITWEWWLECRFQGPTADLLNQNLWDGRPWNLPWDFLMGTNLSCGRILQTGSSWQAPSSFLGRQTIQGLGGSQEQAAALIVVDGEEERLGAQRLVFSQPVHGPVSDLTPSSSASSLAPLLAAGQFYLDGFLFPSLRWLSFSLKQVYNICVYIYWFSILLFSLPYKSNICSLPKKKRKKNSDITEMPLPMAHPSHTSPRWFLLTIWCMFL